LGSPGKTLPYVYLIFFILYQEKQNTFTAQIKYFPSGEIQPIPVSPNLDSSQ